MKLGKSESVRNESYKNNVKASSTKNFGLVIHP